MYFRNIPKVFVIFPWKKKIMLKIIPDCDTQAIKLKTVFHKNLSLIKVEKCRNMQLFGNSPGYYQKNHQNQITVSHHREMIVPLYWAKR